MARQAQAEPISRTAASWYSPGDSPARCRQRRRRRIEMRRARPNCTAALYIDRKRHLPEDVEVEDDGDEEYSTTRAAVVEELSPLPLLRRLSRNPMPVYSTISIEGFAERDGVVWVQEDFCRLAPAEVFAGGEPLHFFAVYDGDASALYKQLMHRFIAEELVHVDASTGGDHGATSDGVGSGDDVSMVLRSREWWNDQLLSALQRSFERMNRVLALETCRRPSIDQQYSEHHDGAVTAVVAVLTAQHIVVARSGGSSHAVLCSDGIPIPLSNDCRHNKPHHHGPPEIERICEADGMIIHNDHNTNGLRGYEILEVSRPLGNTHQLRSSSITPEPEIFIIERSREDDECLIIASDGVWDVMSDDTACNVATTCLRDGHSTTTGTTSSAVPLEMVGDQLINTFGHTMLFGHHDHLIRHDHQLFSYHSSGVDAAAVLCRLALGRGRGSSEGINVIVVDLKGH